MGTLLAGLGRYRLCPLVFNSPTGKLTKCTLTEHWAPAHLFGSHESHWQRLNFNLPPERTIFVLCNCMTDAMFGGRQSGLHLWMKKGQGQLAGRVVPLWGFTDCSALVIFCQRASLFYKLCCCKQWRDKFCLHERDSARSYKSVCHLESYTHSLTELRGATE